MPQTIWLTVRATRKPWLQTVTTVTIASALLLVGSALLHRTLRAADSPQAPVVGLVLALAAVVACTGFLVTYLAERQKLWEAYEHKIAEEVGLSRDTLFVGAQKIPASELKKIIIESAQYAGAPAGRGTASGFGHVLLVYKAGRQETRFPIIVQSAQELEQLRELAAAWRLLGITALVMD